MQARGVFIAGSDTGTGKTLAACALLHALRAAGVRATGMKPVASGCAQTAEGLRSNDALALVAASDPRPARYADCNPFAFEAPASPHIAATEAGGEVEMQSIQDAYDTVALDADAVVVEGIGGWLTPISDTLRANAIPQTLRLPVILVVGLKPGCLSHAQLTARAIHGDDCELMGWIGNRIDPEMARPKENLETLHRALAVPCLGVIAHAAEPATAANSLCEAADALCARSP